MLEKIIALQINNQINMCECMYLNAEFFLGYKFNFIQ